MVITVSCSPFPLADDSSDGVSLAKLKSIYSSGPPSLAKVNAAIFQNTDQPISIWPSLNPSSIDVDSQEPIYDSTFQIAIDGSCDQSKVLHIDRALAEMHQLVFDATSTLLQNPLSDMNRLYWGPSNSTDLSTPVGVFGQVLFGNKDDISISCEDPQNRCGDEFISEVGGYVNEATGSIHLCSSVFESETKRKYIEDICMDNTTLIDTRVCQFWSPMLVKLLLDLPQVTYNTLLNRTEMSYLEVLRSARGFSVGSTHSVAAYLYFILDNFAQGHIKGGCRGIEEKDIETPEDREEIGDNTSDTPDELDNDDQTKEIEDFDPREGLKEEDSPELT